MAGVSQRHSLYGVSVGSSLLGGITRQSIPPNIAERGEASSGEVYPRFQSIVGMRPMLQFDTLAISSALNLIGALGTSIAGLTGGLSFYAQKHTDGGSRAGSSSHRKYNAVKGLLIPRRLSVGHQGDATLTYEAYATYDGTNDPLALTDSVSLPSGIADDERFTLGPVTIGAVALGQVRQLDLDFGINVQTEGADSEIWDRYCSIITVKPVLTLRGVDVQWWKSDKVPLAGLAGTHANTAIYLRKRAAGGTFVADATAQHIKLTLAGLVLLGDGHAASGSGAAEVSLSVPTKYDGTNAPLVVTLSSAIS